MLSFKENIPIILEIVSKIQPILVLDIGAGMGKYGILIREQYLSDKAVRGQLEPIDAIIIDAVEDTKYLLTNRLRSIYNKVYEQDIFDCYYNIKDYDLIIMIDILEHWEKLKGIELIKILLAKNNKNILISTPKRTKMYTKHFYGDPRHHISQFELDDFKDFDYEDFSNNLSHIILIKKCRI
jgi:2-polyprenyl-3-methyl-5-hydroxy-6-metoxy-1,4-benzoquinol methylase